jgi:class 3 adenylate cyclase
MEPVRKWLTHALVYACVNAFLVAMWLLTSGHDIDYVRELVRDDQQNLGTQFWPIWPMLGWGIGLAIHTLVFAIHAPGNAVRAIRRTDRHALAQAASAPARHPSTDPATARRWVVVMFTDVVGSTTLNERLGDEIWHPILAAYRKVVRRAMTTHGGTEVSTTGDGFLVRFDSPIEAVQCAIEIQRVLEDDREIGGTSPNVRIGIHAGEAMDDGSDLLGHVVNLASRVSTAAEPDEILVTEPVADHVAGSVKLADRGLRELKGIGQPRHLLAVRWDALSD